MTTERLFTPDWICPPGVTVATILKEKGLGTDDLAQRINWTAADIELLLNGTAVISENTARSLAETLGSTPDFWLRRETRYRKGLARLHQEAAEAARENWLDDVPVKEMVRFGWIQPMDDRTALAASVLRFFGVPDVATWRRSYQQAIHPAAFRASTKLDSKPGAIAAWLRQGEYEAGKIHCERWDPDAFRRQLQVIRRLTCERDPEVFVPELKRLCADCGVAVVAPLRAPKGCRASGASWFLAPGRPMLMLSFRYLTDDQLWFTFFHEAAHLLLHGNRSLFLEGEGREISKDEEEANLFAANILVPPERQAEMLNLTLHRRPVVRFAHDLGIAPGIIVGQLQKYRDDYSFLNSLKRRYEWSED
jgi:plasmid maintenance system antidote protein VapI